MTILASIFGKVLYSLTLGFLLDSQNHFEITFNTPLEIQNDSELDSVSSIVLRMQHCTHYAYLNVLRNHFYVHCF